MSKASKEYTIELIRIPGDTPGTEKVADLTVSETSNAALFNEIEKTSNWPEILVREGKFFILDDFTSVHAVYMQTSGFQL